MVRRRNSTNGAISRPPSPRAAPTAHCFGARHPVNGGGFKDCLRFDYSGGVPLKETLNRMRGGELLGRPA